MLQHILASVDSQKPALTPSIWHVLCINSAGLFQSWIDSICHQENRKTFIIKVKQYLMECLFPAHLNHIIGATMNIFQYPDHPFTHHHHHKSTHNRPNNRHHLQSAIQSFNHILRRCSRQARRPWTNTVTQRQSSPHIKMNWLTATNGMVAWEA